MNEWAEFRHFRYLLAIVQHEGFRAAAEYLHTAQPNLSAQAKQFQDLSHVHLFQRTKDGRIKLTRTGMAFEPLAKLVLDTRDDVIAALLAIEHDEIQTLRLGSTSLIDQELFHTCCELHKEILPDCPIHPTHGDMAQLEEELINGDIDAAIVTLPVSNPRLHAEVIRSVRLVVCLRRDHPLAQKPIFEASDLQNNLTILYHPERHFHAHHRHREYLRKLGVEVERYSRANHPSELRELVKHGYGFALVREGSKIDDELTTRPVAGEDCNVSIAMVYDPDRHPRTIPVLIRLLKRHIAASAKKTDLRSLTSSVKPRDGTRRRDPVPEDRKPRQMSLLE